MAKRMKDFESKDACIGRPLSMQERFLSQSLKDAQRDYRSSLEPTFEGGWDWVVITASSERQAAAYQIQIDLRLEKGILPKTAQYLIVPDRDGRRIGSGGATLSVYAEIASRIGLENVSSQKIILFHSGGDSKRIPQYSAKGKLFAPTPHEFLDGSRSTIFDDLMVSMSGVASRMLCGTLIVPSDTVVAFNPLQLDLSVDAVGLSMKATVAEGSEHGVFVASADGKVAEFLHKAPESTLYSSGAVDGKGLVDIDTGCIWFGKQVVDALLGLIGDGSAVDQERLRLFAGPEACLSLYADFVYPLAARSTLEGFLEQNPEGAFTGELDSCRRELWDALGGLSIDLARLAPSRYIHFGTTWETLDLLTKKAGKYAFLGWEGQVCSSCTASTAAALSNAVVDKDCTVADGSYIEDSVVSGGASIGEGAVVSGIDVAGRRIPDDTVVHGLQLEDGRWVCRIYGAHDNPKESSGGAFLGATLDAVIARTGVERQDVWSESPASLWNARIYPVRDSQEEALDAALSLCRIAAGKGTEGELKDWLASERESLNSSFNKADAGRARTREELIEDRARVERLVDALGGGIQENLAVAALGSGEQAARRAKRALDVAEDASFPLNMRLYHALSSAARNNPAVERGCSMSWSDLEDAAYGVVKDGIVGALREGVVAREPRFARRFAVADLPVRVNFCGSPSDAAPYCLEKGGTMLDAALLLKGKLPVRVETEVLSDPVVVLESADQRLKRVFTDIEEVRACGDPLDPFALHKACLAAAFLFEGFSSLEQFAAAAGGGIRLATSVDVPKGSGLGTSSILAAGCMKALDEIAGIGFDEDLVYEQVFAVEQLMGTGGGWQDQVGGLTPGLKFFTSKPGMRQVIDVERLSLDPRTARELDERFALIYSGQRRLARNVLRSETSKLIGNDAAAHAAIGRIRELAALMRHYLLSDDVTGFARCMTEQLSLVKELDSGVTNTCVDYIFDVCDDLVDGKSVCGAGGGGFLQVILKPGVSRESLARRLENEFGGCGVELWDARIYWSEEAERNRPFLVSEVGA